MHFPAGSDLIVRRFPGRDPHGDPIGEPSEHRIGPCDAPVTEGMGPDQPHNPNLTNTTLSIRAPSGSDVKKGDEVVLPDGRKASVKSAPESPKNPFTGWAPFLHFNVKVMS